MSGSTLSMNREGGTSWEIENDGGLKNNDLLFSEELSVYYLTCFYVLGLEIIGGRFGILNKSDCLF